MYDYVVIGLGLIGSAALRYLSGASGNVIGIGPAEPANYRDHQGVFASHYDQARITRILDNDLVWATLAERSIGRYRTMEKESGIHFYSEVGCLHLASAVDAQDIAASKKVGDRLRVNYELLDSSNLTSKFPFLRFTSANYGLFEPSLAGFINPRAMIEAQLTIARRNGAQVVRQTVVQLKAKSSHVLIEADDGQDYLAKKVLITAGAFTNCNHLVENQMAYTALARTVLLAKLSDDMVKQLALMPSILWRDPHGISLYVLPPVQYPDGSFYLKIGGGFVDAVLNTIEDFQSWFHSDGSAATAEQLQELLQSMLTELKPLSYTTLPCVVARTESGRPYIDTLDSGQIFLAAGGCGTAAKSADEIGRLGALLTETGAWQDDLPADYFTRRFLEQLGNYNNTDQSCVAGLNPQPNSACEG